MNRRKSTRHMNFGSVLLLLVAAVLVAGAGVFHACVKNRQIEIARAIDKTEGRIGQLDNDTRTLQMYLDRHLNRFKIGERLKQMGSKLIAIDRENLETVNSGDDGEPLPNLVRSGP